MRAACDACVSVWVGVGVWMGVGVWVWVWVYMWVYMWVCGCVYMNGRDPIATIGKPY